MSWKPKGPHILVIVLGFVATEGQMHNVIGFDRTFYYGPEGGSGAVCLEIANYVKPITGMITTKDLTATGGVDYDNTNITVNITKNPSGRVCYLINFPDDSISEGIESLAVVFQSSNTSDNIIRRQATVTITDDDDVNECFLGTHNCQSFDTCINTDGSFRCTDNERGFSDNGLTCEDFDECAAGTHNCRDHSTCKNTAGSFECPCNPGFFEGTDSACRDSNECSVATDNYCTSNATCINTVGSFQCVCNAGYTGNGTFCEDFNECSVATENNCTSNATCINTVGSFQCVCNAGYTGNGTFCEDIDECTSNTEKHNCNLMETTCNDIDGSFRCDCKNNARFCEGRDACSSFSCVIF